MPISSIQGKELQFLREINTILKIFFAIVQTRLTFQVKFFLIAFLRRSNVGRVKRDLTCLGFQNDF